jgi:deoxyribodipyrimidine photo-lyase
LKNSINIFWFRRDLRLNDNAGLFHALKSGLPVLPVFVFDTNILNELEKNDPRVTFIFEELKKINEKLRGLGSSLIVKHGEPLTVWKNLVDEYNILEVYTNHDYEPYSIRRDQQIFDFLQTQNISFRTFKDHLIFEKDEVVKDGGKPYTIYTPYMNKWISRLSENPVRIFDSTKYFQNFVQSPWSEIPELRQIGFVKSDISIPEARLDSDRIENYEQTRNFPFIDGTSMAGTHLRFGTISIRELIITADSSANKTFLKELVWREFFMQILYHFPKVVRESFKPAYDKIPWINNEDHFHQWRRGKTGYPMVDAGMRELNTTGYMHNRVRMIVASFLCKQLLIDWRWGEGYFARKLLDYELSSNNGNWQWAAGTGCDAAPYFRVFNPTEQMKKFDAEKKYIKKWVPELQTSAYPNPVVDHQFARMRAISVYKKGLSGE